MWLRSTGAYTGLRQSSEVQDLLGPESSEGEEALIEVGKRELLTDLAWIIDDNKKRIDWVNARPGGLQRELRFPHKSQIWQEICRGRRPATQYSRRLLLADRDHPG